MKKGNEPAYPSEHPDKPYKEIMGLTKREYFSVLVMQGLISDGDSRGTADDFALSAVLFADALLKELEK